MSHTYLAVDFGGGSGRVMAGTLDHGRLTLAEVYRFPNRQVRMGGHLYWDFLALFDEMKNGLRKAASEYDDIRTIGIDTWGVDYGLLDRAGHLVGQTHCYRDTRTQGLPEEVFARLDVSRHYAEAGTQVMNINTMFQLYSMVRADDPALGVAERLLFMPDLFSYFLTGTANNEYSIASTSELLDARTRQWNRPLIDRLGLPQRLFGDIVMPGTSRGRLTAGVAQELGLNPDVEVIAVGSHDTASAVWAVPQPEDPAACQAFLSSGTWSLLGVELDAPILTEEARLAGFTNEGGVGDKITFLQNITGLWILQQLMAQWKKRGDDTGYDTLFSAAGKAQIDTIIDVDDPVFQSPADMEGAIALYCRQHQLAVPADNAEYTRCLLQSLAWRYKQAIDQMNTLLPRPVTQLCVIGGGSKNPLLNQLTQEALGMPVHAGPAEATAIGNIMVQAMAKRHIASRNEIKEIITS